MNANKTQPVVSRAASCAGEKKKEAIFLNWVEHCSRSDTLAETFLTDIFFVHYLQQRGAVFTALRYICALIHTTALLLWRRPKVVFVMNQPVFLPMLVYLLSFIVQFHYVVDSHSGLFNKKKWIWAQPIMKWVCRRSLFTIVTNIEHEKIVKKWGTDVEILGSLIVSDQSVERKGIGHRQSLVVIGTFAEDEPTREVLRAASCCSEVRFYLTGNYRKVERSVLELRPENVRFTGFLKREEYISLVKSVDGAMILVTSNHTMQRGAYEAMSWGTPMITSDWPILREAFPKGAVFVKNDVGGIVEGVTDFFSRKEQLRVEIQDLRREKICEWDRRIREINTRFNLPAERARQ